MRPEPIVHRSPPKPEPKFEIKPLPKPGETGWNAPDSKDNCEHNPGKKICK